MAVISFMIQAPGPKSLIRLLIIICVFGQNVRRPNGFQRKDEAPIKAALLMTKKEGEGIKKLLSVFRCHS